MAGVGEEVMPELPAREKIEWLALRFLMNGQGVHPVPDCSWATEAVVGFPLEQPDCPLVAFRKDGATTATVELWVVPVAPEKDGGSP